MTNDPVSPVLTHPSHPQEQEPQKPDAPMKAHAPHPKRLGFIAGGFVLMIALVLGMTWVVYNKPPTDPLVRNIVSVFPYPAVKMDGATLTIKDYLIEHDALVSFFDSFEDTQEVERPDPEELERNIIDTMVNKAVVDILAEKYGVEVSEEDVNTMMAEVMAESSATEEEFAAEILETFGWTSDQFKDHVVRPIVVATKLSEYVAGNAEIQNASRERAEDALVRLDAGEDFTVVASETNDDRSAIFGGDLGYLLLSELPAEWLPGVAELEVGDYTQVLETNDGYSILLVNDRIAAGDDEQVHLKLILVRKTTVETLVDDYLAEAKIKRYLGEEI